MCRRWWLQCTQARRRGYHRTPNPRGEGGGAPETTLAHTHTHTRTHNGNKNAHREGVCGASFSLQNAAHRTLRFAPTREMDTFRAQLQHLGSTPQALRCVAWWASTWRPRILTAKWGGGGSIRKRARARARCVFTRSGRFVLRLQMTPQPLRCDPDPDAR